MSPVRARVEDLCFTVFLLHPDRTGFPPRLAVKSNPNIPAHLALPEQGNGQARRFSSPLPIYSCMLPQHLPHCNLQAAYLVAEGQVQADGQIALLAISGLPIACQQGFTLFGNVGPLGQ
jgi:hypothetical protein